jgi:hypothetical protein
MFSRWMPPSPSGPSVSRPVLLALLVPMAAVSVWYLARHPWGAAFGTTCVAAVAGVARLIDMRLEGRARQRTGEDIGSFARAFDRHAPEFDPWVVRAVWDAMAPWTTLRDGTRLPLRPTDVIADLGCVGTDVDDVVGEVAARTRRSLADPGTSPDTRPVVTVNDLVAFIAGRPPTGAA